jgi:serine/threonine-protein kinase
MASEIALNRKWTLGAKLGSGGFGTVYEATGDDGTKAAVKFIRKEPGAQRELLFEDDLSGVPGVVPVIDSGEHVDNWVIVMPRADKSLLAHLNTHGGRLPEDEAVAILKAVGAALVALVDRKVVHRDIKPANILLVEGNWCLADFGIARYAEASTAPDTRKLACSPPYSAPERWRDERATSKSDIYSVGIMAFEMLEGHLPFPGPYVSDFRDQHLHTRPPKLTACSDALAALVTECLYKPPETRPSAANLHARLERMSRPRSAGSSAKYPKSRSKNVTLLRDGNS